MARLPHNARLWKERAEIDYIGPFVKAWASFNAWYREETGQRQDRRGLEHVKNRANSVRSEIIPLLRPRENLPDGGLRPDSEVAQEFKLLIADLHRFLEQFRIEVVRENDELERITLTSVAIRPRVPLPQTSLDRGITFTVDRQDGEWVSTVTNRAGQVTTTINQVEYDEQALIVHPEYAALWLTSRDISAVCISIAAHVH